MNKFILLFSLLLISSCGNLSITPKGCHSKGIYANKDDQLINEKTFDYNIYFMDRELKLSELIDCKKVELLKITMKKKFFFKYYLTLNYKENDVNNFKEEK